MKLVFKVDELQDNVKLSLFLRRQGLSASLIKSVKYVPGGICVNGISAKTNQLLYNQDLVTFELGDEEEMVLEPEEVPISIVYESQHAMVINKAAGQVMHPTLSHHSGTIGNGFTYLMQQRNQKVAFRPVGRLDRNTSGLVLCAMNAFSAPLLSKNNRKEYVALVEGELKENTGVIELPIAPSEDSIIKQRIHESGKKSITEYTVLEKNKEASLVKIQLLTGRTHQIRVHFSAIGHPLFGDELYGGTTECIQRHALHCTRLTFPEPQQEKLVSLFSNMPNDMLQACEFLKIDAHASC